MPRPKPGPVPGDGPGVRRAKALLRSLGAPEDADGRFDVSRHRVAEASSVPARVEPRGR